MQKGDAWTLTFAAIVCVACSLVISTASTLLHDRQAFNREIDRKVNILKAFGVENTAALSGQEVENIFKNHIHEVVIDRETGNIIPGLKSSSLTPADLSKHEKLPLYQWIENGKVTRVAFPLQGMGLWSVIHSYMALEKDMATIRGITFYDQQETPGLGGEVASDWFQSQFQGKKIWENGQYQPFEVVKGSVKGKYPDGSMHAVDGISGATMTGKGVTRFLNEYIGYYTNYLDKARGA